MTAARAEVVHQGRCEECACGRPVVGERGARAWHFYCCDCGRDWEREAPPVTAPRPRAIPGKRCTCRFVCHFCKKAKR